MIAATQRRDAHRTCRPGFERQGPRGRSSLAGQTSQAGFARRRYAVVAGPMPNRPRRLDMAAALTVNDVVNRGTYSA